MMTARAKLLKEIEAGTPAVAPEYILLASLKRPKAGRLSMRYEVTCPTSNQA